MLFVQTQSKKKREKERNAFVTAEESGSFVMTYCNYREGRSST
jgi:hypothetical protein